MCYELGGVLFVGLLLFIFGLTGGEQVLLSALYELLKLFPLILLGDTFLDLWQFSHTFELINTPLNKYGRPLYISGIPSLAVCS